MSMITDVLNLGRKEASMICSAYPEWILLKIASINSVAARYRLFVPSEDVREDDYFLFLLKNRLALASVNFRLRLKEDRKFRERVRKVVSGL